MSFNEHQVWRFRSRGPERPRGPSKKSPGAMERKHVRLIDREHVKGAADKVKGAIKDTVGKMTGDRGMQAEGKMDKAKGLHTTWRAT